MNLYDISQELFSSPVYPGDPLPHKEYFLNIDQGDICNLTVLSMGSHVGTHMDAPRHFYVEGDDICQIPLSKCIGECKVISAPAQKEPWIISGNDMKKLLADGTKKLLIKGIIEITEAAAAEMVQNGLELIGVEGQTVGPADAPAQVHYILLAAKVVILEGLCLGEIPCGNYILSASPLKMDGLDGSPVRAVLIEQTDMVSGYDEDGIHGIRLSDIYYLEAVADRVFIHCKDKVYESRKKLYELEALGRGFFRASRSTIVNINMLEYTRPSLSGRFRAYLTNGEEMEVSRQYIPALRRMLGV